MAPTNTAEVLGIGLPEMLIILGIVVLLFGAKKLPELSKSLGQSVKEIRRAASEAGSLKADVTANVDTLTTPTAKLENK
jgi:sec-independent protein translocase protein TatA